MLKVIINITYSSLAHVQSSLMVITLDSSCTCGIELLEVLLTNQTTCPIASWDDEMSLQSFHYLSSPISRLVIRENTLHYLVPL